MSSRSSKAKAPPSGAKNATRAESEKAVPPAMERAAVPSPDAEWLETDGLGGFASGTVSGIRTRREHALLLVAPAHALLVNGLDARVTMLRGMFDISSHHYDPDVVHPEGHRHIESFTSDPWP